MIPLRKYLRHDLTVSNTSCSGKAYNWNTRWNCIKVVLATAAPWSLNKTCESKQFPKIVTQFYLEEGCPFRINNGISSG